MKRYDWNPQKNEKLKRERGISFEEIVFHIANGDEEEREILQAFEMGEMQPAPDKENELEKHREYAEATFKKDKRITIRISSRDLNALRKRALVEGIPYQTLVTSVLHKYVNQQLVEKQPVE